MDSRSHKINSSLHNSQEINKFIMEKGKITLFTQTDKIIEIVVCDC